MKVDGNGRAKVLLPYELKALFDRGFIKPRDKALFGICLFTGSRISETLALYKTDILIQQIIFKRANTKGKTKSRVIDLVPEILKILEEYQVPLNPNNPYLFPSRLNKPITRSMAHRILDAACDRVDVKGASTHSFRRTALTQMHNAGVPLRHIQAISGHSSLAALQVYLDVTDEDKKNAVSVIGW